MIRKRKQRDDDKNTVPSKNQPPSPRPLDCSRLLAHLAERSDKVLAERKKDDGDLSLGFLAGGVEGGDGKSGSRGTANSAVSGRG